MLLGIVFGCVYLAFAVAVVAAAGALVRGRSAAAAVTVVALLSLPVLGLVGWLQPWLPSELVGALDALAAGSDPADYTRAVASAVVATVALLGFSIVRLERREL